MARAKKIPEEGGGVPPWMVTFSDIMTLLLTFFVLLISMAQFDERRTREFLVTTRGNMGVGTGIFNPLAKEDKENMVQPGPMDAAASEDLEMLRRFMWDNKDEDINLESNRFIVTISVGDDVLFEPGSSQLTTKGILLLNQLIPQLKQLAYPMLIAGHTATERDEAGPSYRSFGNNVLSPTWKLSFSRAMAVYEHFLKMGIPASSLMVEAFGEYRPKASNGTPKGRATNRRVDLVLDRRNPGDLTRLKLRDEQNKERENTYEYKDFRFKLDIPQRQPEEETNPEQAPVLGVEGALYGAP